MSETVEATVTFLFTDIEGSTRLLDALGDDYGELLAEHQRLLRAAFAAHHGHEVDTQGDAFFITFPTPRDAVLAAIDAQRALAEHEWPNGVRVRVRIGMDTGRAALLQERYTGHAVHRAARVSAAGHGGQILVSDASEQLLGDDRDGFRLRDLGRRRLKDISGRVRIYQVDAPALERSFPEVRTLDVVHRRRRRLALALGAVTVAVAAAFAYVLTRPPSVPVSANSVAVIGPRKNEVLAAIPVGNLPHAIAAGSGAVWVANEGEGTVSQIDPFTKTVLKTITLLSRPDSLAAAPGAVWVYSGVAGTVTPIDPDVGVLAKTGPIKATGFSPGGGGGSVTIGGGAVWAVSSSSTVAKVASERHHVTTDSAGRVPRGIAFGAGSLWVANHSENNVYRFDPRSFGHSGYTTPPCARHAASRCRIPVGLGPSGIAVGGGYVWVADADADALTRIDPRTSETTSIDVGRRPVGVAYGEGAVWVANGDDGTVSRIDPANGKVKTIHVGHSPAGVAVGEGLVWVTVDPK